MAGTQPGKRFRRALGVLMLVGALGAGATMIATATHARAGLEALSKTCTGPDSDNTADAGATVHCVISAGGIFATGESWTVSPAPPTGGTVTSCAGFTQTTPVTATYVTTATQTGTASCTYSFSTALLTFPPGIYEVGTEDFLIPAGTSANSVVTQTACEQEPLPPGAPCIPVVLAITGPGSCIDGTYNGVFGCPALPSASGPLRPR